MISTEQLYLHFLRNAIWNTDIAVDVDNADWQALMNLAEKQGTTPLVYDQVLRGNYGVPEALVATMRQTCMQNMMQQARLKEGLVYTFDTLKNAGIKPVLLKGFGLAQLYPLPYLRAWGDLDVYVGPEQYHAAAAVLRKAFPEARHHDEEWEELKHYNFVLPDGSLVEMHRTTMAFFSERDKRLFDILEKEAMNDKTADIEGYEVNIPDDFFNMLFVFMHAWEHFYESGAGMKQIADVALLAHSLYHNPDCDKQQLASYLHTNLRRVRMLQPWRIMGYLIVKALRLPQDEWPGYDNGASTRKYGERLYKRVMQEGMMRPKDFGDSRDRYEARDKAMRLPVWKRKWLTVKSKVNDCTPMWHYAPGYTLHRLSASLWHGVKRTLRGEKMVLY